MGTMACGVHQESALRPLSQPEVENRELVVTVAPPSSAAAPRSPADAAPLERTPTCPSGEVWVPASEGFIMGRGLAKEHRVVLTKGFCMDATEVTVAAYQDCVDRKKCRIPWMGDPYSMYPRFPDHPVNMVSWTDARAYCDEQGKRLPTEAEWEWAATGPEQYTYPWGNTPEPSCDLVDFTKFGAPKMAAGGDYGCHGGGPSAVGSHPKGDRLWGEGRLHDLAGNVWEWVEDSFEPYAEEPATDPLVRRETAVHALRGGGWNRSYAGMVVTYRAAAHFNYRVPGTGFRCVRGAPHPTPPPRSERHTRL